MPADIAGVFLCGARRTGTDGRNAAYYIMSQFSYRPLADALRPTTFDEVVGQSALQATALEKSRTSSLILWGPAGTGKTTIARVLGAETDSIFSGISAVFDGVGELRKVFAVAEERARDGTQTILFVDEIHRFNKAQQDALLPAVETGTIRLIGATTENPSFSLNSALLSRVQIIVLSSLDEAALEQLISRAETHYQRALPVTDEARAAVIAYADGDGRYVLNLVERLYDSAGDTLLSMNEVAALLSQRALNYDKGGDDHYNLISAFYKSLRASDCDAALYWLARMMLAGEDPGYILRRLTRFASEDIGLAEPEAVVRAIAAWESYDRLGSPEGDLALAELVIFLSTAPKSNAACTAWKSALAHARQTGAVMAPTHVLNAPTHLMKLLDYGKAINMTIILLTVFRLKTAFQTLCRAHVISTQMSGGLNGKSPKGLPIGTDFVSKNLPEVTDRMVNV